MYDSSPRLLQETIITKALWTLAGLIAGIGLLTLLGWVLDDIPSLTSLQSGQRTLSPISGVLSLLLSSALGLCLLNSSNRSIKISAKLIIWLGALVALLLCFLSIKSDYLPAEHLGLSFYGLSENSPVSYISIITAFCFLLAFINLLILNTPKPVIPWRIRLGYGVTAIILFISLGFLLAYSFDLPLFITNIILLPTLNSVLSLPLIGLALLILNYQAFYISQSVSQSVSQSDIMLTKLPAYLLVFVIFSAGIIFIAYDYYQDIELKFHQKIEDELLTIAKLKSDQLIL